MSGNLGHGFAGHVVHGWTKSAGDQHEFHPSDRVRDGPAYVFDIVPDHGLEPDFDSMLRQRLAEKKRIGIDLSAKQQFGSDRNDFSRGHGDSTRFHTPCR